MIEVLEHIPDEEVPKFMKIICEKLKSNGVLILTVPSDVRQVNKKHFRHYDKDLVINTLEDCGLKIENIEGIYKEDWLVRLLLKINSNSLYTISNRHIQAFISKRIHSRQSSLNESSSTHWCAVGKKI